MMGKHSRMDERHYERLSPSQRIQHIIMMTSFFALVATGLPVLFPDNPASDRIISFIGGFTARAIIHRLAALALIGICAFHVGWTILTRRGQLEFMALMPNKKDMFDVVHQMKFFFGLEPDRPRFDRYNFIEKFEYLALGWGSVVMIVTGFLLWFENQALLVFPKWALDVAQIVHSYEALLAFLAIIIWHFYHVHLNPEVFPMSKIWLTGKISEHELMAHHPLEYERITRDRQQPEEIGIGISNRDMHEENGVTIEDTEEEPVSEA